MGNILLWQTTLPQDGEFIDRFVLVEFVVLCPSPGTHILPIVLQSFNLNLTKVQYSFPWSLLCLKIVISKNINVEDQFLQWAHMDKQFSWPDWFWI